MPLLPSWPINSKAFWAWSSLIVKGTPIFYKHVFKNPATYLLGTDPVLLLLVWLYCGYVLSTNPLILLSIELACEYPGEFPIS